jgi:hypothetical protein
MWKGTSEKKASVALGGVGLAGTVKDKIKQGTVDGQLLGV